MEIFERDGEFTSDFFCDLDALGCWGVGVDGSAPIAWWRGVDGDAFFLHKLVCAVMGHGEVVVLHHGVGVGSFSVEMIIVDHEE